MKESRQQRRKAERQMQKLLDKGKRMKNPERIPDGRINTYTCPNDHVLVTRDAIKGVTPMTVDCPTCGQRAMSAWYRCDQALTPTHEWDRPPVDTWPSFGPQMVEHFRLGGLMITKI